MAAGAVAVPVVAFAPAAAAAACDAPVTNKVACENTKAGTANWQVAGIDDSIAGYTTDISTNVGGTVDFKVKTDASSYSVTIYRLGWYGGLGARQVGQALHVGVQNQPACLVDGPTQMVDCGNWGVSASWQVPADAVSGLYYAVLHRNDTGGENEVPFVVRDDSSTAKVLFQTADATWHAYNRYGGNSLYTGTGPGDGGSSYGVSYNRPITGGGEENYIFNAEYPMLKFMEANGYDMTYSTNVDSARRGQLIKNHRVFLAVGHDEYWSAEQRDNVEAARDAGVNLAFFTGNEVFWKHRWTNSLDASGTAWRNMTIYKETKANAKIDPSAQWTGTWRDPRFSPPSDGGRPENSLLGNLFTVNGRRDDSLSVPAAYGKMRLWRGTPLATMTSGSYTFQPGTLGYEWNSVEENGAQPAGVAQLSRTTVTMDGSYVLQNYGDVYKSGTKTHALTLYRAPSGALVFGAGTVQWAWGLDDEHAFRTDMPTSDIRIQQATVNLMADMGVQAGTLRTGTGLVAASASTDTAPPTVAINSTTNGTVAQSYTFGGSVSDAAGKVAGVEVSVDGSTWHAANWTAGTTTWNYTYTPPASGTATLRVRAVDDSANLSAVVSRAVTVNTRTCPCSIWASTDVPTTPAANDVSAVELGVKFTAATDGYIRGVKFYKGTGNSGTHTGSLWSATGQLLATGTFGAETATGWQTLAFPTAVAITGGTTYVASYHTDTGRYAADQDYFSKAPISVEPLTAKQSVAGDANGVYRVGASGFPSDSYRATNYWVDVVYALDPGPDTRPPAVASTSPGNNQGSVTLTAPISVTWDEPVTLSSAVVAVNGPNGGVSGSLSLSSDQKTVTFTPAQNWAGGTSYSVSTRAYDLAGNAPQNYTFSFKTGTPRASSCPCSVWDDFAVPATASVNDVSAIEVGTKVRFDVRGQVTGVKFYKGDANTGTHTGSLWDASGNRLATGTFANETANGWQTLLFSSPVNVQANTTYVVSYYAPNGRYAATGGYFSKSADYQSLHAVKDGTYGGNGLYRYGAGGGFPTGTYNATNYWVDVLWTAGANGDTTPPTIVSRTPAESATNVPLNSPVTMTFSEPVDLSSAQFSMTDPGWAKLGGALTISADQKTVTFTPSAPMVGGSYYLISMRIADANGVLMTGASLWNIWPTTTATCPCSLFSAATTPTVESANDTSPYELGVRFTAATGGYVKGVRFYKGSLNTGTHTGSLWDAAGNQLATGTFAGETATGWQTLLFATPVPITAGQTYVASYTTTVGRYAADSGYFNRTSVNSPPLAAGSNPNGVYRVGSGFPNSSYGGANYWVDVLFDQNQ
ncbi:hypothetical protein BJP25_29965 [Actinokineospora bangkokensis]|uniref:Ig-like domain-containing protein n=1 Tax=Actinokineospora bangkokensis TaxID=1193682 RepID=A0A1Q9LGL1_9PSEU|nr:hypothetical protein BJP25_29965 [Actinokineospora bangkokensis]